MSKHLPYGPELPKEIWYPVTNLIFDHPEQWKTLVSELLKAVVLDTGATNTVAGKVRHNLHNQSKWKRQMKD